MVKRVDVGTDISMIGAWDARRDDIALSQFSTKKAQRIWQDDAAEGHLFFIETGGDCGGPLDVYVDEKVPDEVRDIAKPVGGEFLIAVPSGRLVVGGVEDYRSETRRITGEQSVVMIPSGDYLLQCHVANSFYTADYKSGGPPLEMLMARALSAEDRAYVSAVNRRQYWRLLYMCLPSLLLIPALWPWYGWKIALGVAVGVLVAWSHLLDWRWRQVPQDERHRRIIQTLRDAYVASHSPMWIFELHRIADRGKLRGGFVEL